MFDESFIIFVIIFSVLIIYYFVKGIIGIRRKSISIFFFTKTIKIKGDSAKKYSLFLILIASAILLLFIFLLQLYIRGLKL